MKVQKKIRESLKTLRYMLGMELDSADQYKEPDDYLRTISVAVRKGKLLGNLRWDEITRQVNNSNIYVCLQGREFRNPSNNNGLEIRMDATDTPVCIYMSTSKWGDERKELGALAQVLYGAFSDKGFTLQTLYGNPVEKMLVLNHLD